MRLTAELSRSLAGLVAGDAAEIAPVLRAPHHMVEEAARDLPPLLVTAAAAARVVEAVLCGEISPEQAQGWASFVRRGYTPDPTSSAPIRPIDITYEPDDEDAIVEVVSRLDEIGDVIDGTIGREELQSLRASLTGRR